MIASIAAIIWKPGFRQLATFRVRDPARVRRWNVKPKTLKRPNRILFKPRHLVFIIYITMSETFIKIDLL